MLPINLILKNELVLQIHPDFCPVTEIYSLGPMLDHPERPFFFHWVQVARWAMEQAPSPGPSLDGTPKSSICFHTHLRICPHRWHRCVSPANRGWLMDSSCFQSQEALVRAWCPLKCWHCWPHLAAREKNTIRHGPRVDPTPETESNKGILAEKTKFYFKK